MIEHQIVHGPFPMKTAPTTPPKLTALWVLDTLGALGFAYGLAGAVASFPHPGSALPGFVAVAVLGGSARALGAGGATVLGVWSARQQISALRRAVFLRTLSPQGLSEGADGARSAAAIEEVEAQEGFFGRYLPLRQASAMGPVLILAAVALASWVSALILIATLLPLVLILALVGMAAKEAADRQFLALERLSARFVDRVRALPLILAFQAEEPEAALVARSAESLSERTLSVLRVAFLSSAALEFFSAISVALVAVYAGFSLLGLLPFHPPEHLDLRRAFFVLALAPEFYLPLRRLASAYHDKQVGEAATARLGPLEPKGGDVQTHAVLTGAPEIAFETVLITYEGGASIGPVSFTAEPGRITALVGATGSGKSSLLKLLVGLTSPASGRVLIEGGVLNDAQEWTCDIAWVGQTPRILPMTIGQNIGLARPEATRADIECAALTAGLGPVLQGRALGLDTPIDERGSGLSGGERRRIAMARALLKAAPILLLDEPTADLDARAERDFIEIIKRLGEGRTVLMATHSAELARIAHKLVRLP